jgi:hypothetical protein
MTIRRRRSQLRISFTTRKLRFLGAMLVATTAAYFATPTPASASPFTYTLENTSASFEQGQVTFTGTFTFDPNGPTLSQVMITAAGPTPPLGTTPELYDLPVQAVSDSEVRFASSSLFGELFLFFQNPLDDAADPLSSVLIRNQLQIVEYGSTTATGSAVPVPVPVPGPIASLVLLAIGLFFLRPMANRRAQGAT